MPFTPSHAVVALPFVRTPLLPAAIAIGAMAPDLPLFVRGTPLSYQATHTNVALSTAIALVLLGLWYALFRPAVRELAPEPVARRLPPAWDATVPGVWRTLPARRPILFAGLVVVSLVLGVLSHIAWDAFTHEGRWGTRLLPALAAQWGPLSGYKWVQHGSSVLGLVILAVWAGWWLSRRRPAASVDRVLPAVVRYAWWVSLPALLVGAWLVGLVAYGPLSASWTVQHLAYRVLPPACAVWGALTVVVCIAVVVRRRRVTPA